MQERRYIFKKTHELDKDKFAELLLAAKGERRSMRAFALECGADPSTFTRIIQKTNKGASSLVLIESLAQHADPDSGVTLQQIAHANGYTVSATAKGNVAYTLASIQNVVRTTRMVILDELMSRNYAPHFLLPENTISSHTNIPADIIISSDAFGAKDELWLLNVTRTEGYDIHSDLREIDARRSLNIPAMLGSFLLTEETKPNPSQPYRYSVVFFNREVFEEVKERYGRVALTITVSFVLIDSYEGVIVDEFFLPHKVKGRQQSFFLPERAQGL